MTRRLGGVIVAASSFLVVVFVLVAVTERGGLWPVSPVPAKPQEAAYTQGSPLRDPVVQPGEVSVRVPILMYHRIRDITPEMTPEERLMSVSPAHFRAQMREIADLGYTPISPAQLYDALMGQSALPPKAVLLTFDDGFQSQYDEAFPVLKERNFKATFLIISKYPGVPEYMTVDELKTIDASGLVTIAAHTQDHADLGTLAADAEEQDIVGSKSDLEQLLGHPVEDFGYPYGSVTGTAIEIVRRANFRLAFGTLLGSLHTPSSRFDLRRITVTDNDALKDVLPYFSKGSTP